jgi:fido (protein-threonine AMPylation protein)
MTPFQADESSTPLNPDEVGGLIPSHVTLRHELNEIESFNILAADLWAFRRHHTQLLTEPFLLRLHQRMFNRVWRWAGRYPADEYALRFHHRLVSVHPFPNGNGRHSRLMADLIARQLGVPRFSWGGNANLTSTGQLRRTYINALQSADRHNYAPLLRFARS